MAKNEDHAQAAYHAVAVRQNVDTTVLNKRFLGVGARGNPLLLMVPR